MALGETPALPGDAPTFDSYFNAYAPSGFGHPGLRGLRPSGTLILPCRFQNGPADLARDCISHFTASGVAPPGQQSCLGARLFRYFAYPGFSDPDDH